MAKRKGNRAARQLFGMRRWISNRMFFSGEKAVLTYWRIKPSKRAQRAEAHEPETARCPGCGKRGESNQTDGGFYCYGSDRCCP